MAPKNIIGIDHAVLMVKDLDKAAENWKRLGLAVSPRGTYSAHLGSGNYTIMFDPQPHGIAPLAELLSRRRHHT